MDFETFQGIVKRTAGKRPFLFELKHDSVPTVEDVIALQKQHQIVLPEKFIQFLLRFGGGYFGYANIYSLDQSSQFFLFRHNPPTVKDLLFIADNGCGDYYAVWVEDGKCGERIVFYDHEEGAVQDTNFSDVLEYLMKIGLNQK